jgi:hypothetical protein
LAARRPSSPRPTRGPPTPGPKPTLYPFTGPQPFNLFTRLGILFELRNQVPVPQGLLGNGTVEFIDAGVTDGGRVSGHFSAEVFSWPFGG